MSFISDYLTPFFKWYDRAIDGEYIATQLQFKGGKETGVDYFNKVQRAERRRIQSSYDDTLEVIKSPNFLSFTQDNVLRLLLNPFDRLVAAYQAYPSLKARFRKPGTFSHTFTEILNEGAILGAFKGFIYNFAQFGLVLYPSVYFANKSDEKFLTFLSTYTFLDALFYPLDSLKNILYADTLGEYKSAIKTATTRIALLDLYRGLPLKLAYNLPVLSGIYCTTQVGYEWAALFSWALAFALYPLNTQKVRAQVSASSLSTVNSSTSPVVHSGFRGALLYVLLNAVVGYSLRPLFSSQKLAAIDDQVKADLKDANFL